MALSSSGPIKFSQIKAEFGDSNGSDPGVSLGKYRVSETYGACLLYTSPSPRDATLSRMPSSA